MIMANFSKINEQITIARSALLGKMSAAVREFQNETGILVCSATFATHFTNGKIDEECPVIVNVELKL
jgi:hypothetical protein